MQETSKKQVSKAIASADMLQEVSRGGESAKGAVLPSCVCVCGGGGDWTHVMQCRAW